MASTTSTSTARQNPTNPTNPTPDSKLSAVQQRVIAALANGRTISAAAADVQMHRSTIYEWRKTVPVFREALAAARAEYTAQLSDEMKDLSASALETVRALWQDAQMPPSVRLRAALAILERGGWNLPAAAEQGPVDRNSDKHVHRNLDREIKEQLLALGSGPIRIPGA